MYFADKFKIFISIYLISDLIFLFIIDIFCTTLIPQHYYKLNFYQYSEIIRSLMSIYFCGGYCTPGCHYSFDEPPLASSDTSHL